MFHEGEDKRCSSKDPARETKSVEVEKRIAEKRGNSGQKDRRSEKRQRVN
jgi:hypothetical protein